MSDIAIRVENLSKRYRIGAKEVQHDTFAAALLHQLRHPTQNLRRLRRLSKFSENGTDTAGEDDVLWALKDVSFEVQRGDVVGVIGRNGAGKSTLLKILSRITHPTSGRIELHGRVSSLLEVGTGFHPELTGRENVYLNGTILGMRKVEIDKKFDEIVDFSGVEKFIDTPVKRYSSGMRVRLAFSVAAHLEPEILLVDEVLAVGDAEFQEKCIGKMENVVGLGKSIIFVSHNMAAVKKLCPKSILLEMGSLSMYERTEEVIPTYLGNTKHTRASIKFPFRASSSGQIEYVRLIDSYEQERCEFSSAEKPIVEIGFRMDQAIRGCHVACIVSTQDGYHIFSTADTDTNPSLFSERKVGRYVTRVHLDLNQLNVGHYRIAIGLGIPGIQSFDRQEAISFSIFDAGEFSLFKERGQRSGLLLVELPWEYI